MSNPQPAEYPQRPTEPRQPRNGFGITALVLALVGLVFGLVPLTGFIALILGGLAVVFGLLGVARARTGVATNRTMSIISTVLGAAVAALGIWGMSIVFGAVEQLERDLDAIVDGSPGTGSSVPGIGQPGALHDVTVNGCSTRVDYGMTTAEADVTITNPLDRNASYFVTIAVDTLAGDRLGEILVVRNELAPNQSATVTGMDASTLLDRHVEEITCTVVDVDRMAF